MQPIKLKLLRIAFNDLGHGGIQSQFVNVTKRLINEVDTDLIVWSSASAFYDEDFSKYGRVIYCPHYEGKSVMRRKLDFYTRYFKVKRDVYRVIKENGPYNAVHCHKFFECAPCLAAAKKAGIPIRIAHSHNTALPNVKRDFTYYLKQLYYSIYRRIIRKNATVMIGCSQQAADYLFGNGFGHAVYNAVDLNKFNPQLYPSAVHEGLRLVHVGKYCLQKNQLFLLDVLYELKKILPDSHLSMIGSGDEYFEAVKKKTEKLDLMESVVFLPHDSYVPQVLSQNDIFVFPSSFEGFGNVLIEAQAMGLKCFVSTECTAEADCGLLTFIPLADGAQKWAKTIKEYYDEHGQDKYNVDVSRFDPQTNAETMLMMYKGEYK